MLIVAACSSVKTIHRPIHDSTLSNVDLDLNEQTKSQKNESIKIQKNEETVRIGDKGGEVFSNSFIDNFPAKVSGRDFKIGLAFGPGLNRAINYISVLKVLEKQNMTPSILTGTEFGAIIAAMYASGMTPEMIEWTFFKYLKEKKKSKVFEKDWLKELDEMVLVKLKDSKIEDTKKKLYLTLYDHRTKKAYFFDHGNIRDLLMLNLHLSNNPTTFRTGEVYSAAFEKEVFNSRLLKSRGSDFTIGFDALGSKIEFDVLNEYASGILNKVSGKISRERVGFDYFSTLPLSKLNLDSTKDMTSSLQFVQDFTMKQVPNIKKKIQIKKEEIEKNDNSVNR